jgi:hypothetical protein
MSFCALCVRDSPCGGVSWVDGGKTYVICQTCATEQPVAKYGVERSYEGGGPSMTHADAARGARRVMGDARFEQEMARAQGTTGVVGRAKPKAEVDYAVFRMEGRRLNRAGSLRSTHRARKMAQAPSRREKVGRVKILKPKIRTRHG